MPSGGDQVTYNYPLMEGIAQALHQCGTTAQFLLDAGRASKQALSGSYLGASADVFQDSFTKFEHVNQDTIDITMKGVVAYNHGTSGMQSAEGQMAGYFP